MEKGFNKASLRKISADAGLTTGAIYFFFKDKDGLFGAIVDEPLNKVMQIVMEHGWSLHLKMMCSIISGFCMISYKL